MSSFKCPYCNNVMSISNGTKSKKYPSFNFPTGKPEYKGGSEYESSCIEITFYKCPNCNKYTIFAKGMGSEVSSIDTILQPSSLAIQFPDYVPQQIREDYEEACAIVNLSPKASATLSRRCLQGMIQDYWHIRKNRLVDQIDALKDKVPVTQWNVLNSLRDLGNIGAHPEADVNLIIDINPEDAQKLIAVIELLIKQWYIDKHDEECLMRDVIQIDENAQSQRHSNSNE